MPEVKFQANRLVGTDVNRVSLVKRGASRLPFRVTKSENEPVLDIGKIGRSLFKKADAPPALVAVILSKSADPAVAGVIFTEFGITDEAKLTKSEDDASQTFAVTGVEFDAEQAGVLRLNDDVAIVVSDLKKAFSGYDFTSPSFKDVMAQGAFFPSVSVALDMMRTTTMNIMDAADDPAGASEGIQKAGEEFIAYLSTLTKALPVHAFKAEERVTKAMPAFIQAAIDKKKRKETDDKKDVKKEDPNEKISARPVFGNATEAFKTGVKSKDIEANPVAGNGTETPKIPGADGNIEGDPVFGNGTQKPTPAALAKGDEDGDDKPITSAGLNAILTSFADTLSKGLGESLQKQGERLDGLAAKVDVAVTAARKAEETVSSTVFGSEVEDRTGTRTTKSETSTKAPPLLDTGYDRRHLREDA